MKYLPLIFILIFASGCASDGSFQNPFSGIQVETPDGEKIGCVQDLEACNEICDVQTKDGLKIKTTTKLKPEMCEADEKETQPTG